MTTKDDALKRTPKLARFDLIPPKVLQQLAEHYGRCAVKYPPNNWRKGTEWGVHFAALQRHLTAYWSGEDYDTDPTWAENGVSDPLHLVAALWNVVALIEAHEAHPERDDRFPVNNPRVEDDIRRAMAFEPGTLEEPQPAAIVSCNLCEKHVDIPSYYSVAQRRDRISAWLANHGCPATSTDGGFKTPVRLTTVNGKYKAICDNCGEFVESDPMRARALEIVKDWQLYHLCPVVEVTPTEKFRFINSTDILASECTLCGEQSGQYNMDARGHSAVRVWNDMHVCKPLPRH